MNIILLSGGTGKRLWPLTNNTKPKAFLEVFKREDGLSESMLQRTYRMIHEVFPDSLVTIAASENHIDLIREQIGEDAFISAEPCSKNAFPAISLASAYLYDVLGVSKDESVIVCPIDSYVRKIIIS